MKTSATIHVRLVFENPRALKAIRAAISQVEQLEDLASRRPEVLKAAKALRYAAKHLKFASGRSLG